MLSIRINCILPLRLVEGIERVIQLIIQKKKFIIDQNKLYYTYLPLTFNY